MSAIKPGDLVMVVRPRTCGCVAKTNGGLGLPFTVKATFYATAVCELCAGLVDGWMASSTDDEYWTEVGRLKKIDPPALSDTTPTEREVYI